MAPSVSPKKSASTFLLKLGSQREEFLDKVEGQIAQYVKNEGFDCLAVVEKKSQSEDKTHTPEILSEFSPAFVCFMLGKKYRGNEVESALVEPIVTIICNAYTELLDSNAEDLAELLDGRLARNVAKLSLLEIREHCAKQAARSAKAASKILEVNGHLVSASVVKEMSLKPIIARGIDILLAKMIGKTIIEETAKAVGLETVAALAINVAVAALALDILYQVIKLPKRLGKDLGAGIRSMLEGKLDKLNRSVFKALNQELLKLSILDVLSDYATSTVCEVVKGTGAGVCKELIKKLPLGAHPLDALFKALWKKLKSSKGLHKDFVIALMKKKMKDLPVPAAGIVLDRLQELVATARTMSMAEIVATLISIRLCTDYNLK